jgi:hypothetical protein
MSVSGRSRPQHHKRTVPETSRGNAVVLLRRLPWRSQGFAFLHDIHGKHLGGLITRLNFVHYTWSDVPRLTGVNRLAGLTALQHRKVAFE